MTNQPKDSGNESTPQTGETARRIFEPQNALGEQPESAATLYTVAEMVRRTIRADTTSVGSVSLADRTITWKAMSGFRSRPDTQAEVTIPLRGQMAERAASGRIMILNGIGARPELPAADFPLHSAEGVIDLALVPLGAGGEHPGALAVGYRAPHAFTEEEQQLLMALAELAALAMENARLLETVGTAKKVWEQTFDAIPDGIIVHDRLMRVVRCNAHAALMMDLTPAQVVGLSCADAFARLFGERAAAYHMGQGIGVASSFELQAEDGRRYLVSVAPITSLESGIASQSSSSSQPTDAEQQRATAAAVQPATVHPTDSGFQTYWSVITWSDVTELSEMQEQLSRSRRLATVGQLAAGVAHEINNPLAAINTCAEAVVRDLRETPETLALAESRDWNYYLEEIIRQVFRCKEITRGLLDLSRQRRPRRLASDLNSLAAEAARLTEQRVESEAVSLVVKLDENVGAVATDEGMVRQVLDNLLSNALDAVGESGQITVSTLRAGERIAIEVADNGQGIAPELLVRIFDPFFTTKDPGKGSGLGLAICYTLAEALGGALTVESKPATGSRFRLWLPRRPPEKEDGRG